jgi:prophage regulatory protein
MSATILPPASVLRFRHVQERTRLSRSAIYAKIAAGDFPSPISLGPRAVGWLESDIQLWITTRLPKQSAPNPDSKHPEEAQ